MILPVFVLTSHLPLIISPIGGFGIFILPVFVVVVNTIFGGSFPETLPVLVFIKISGEKELFNITFPVVRLIKILFLEVKLLSIIDPVSPLETKVSQFIFSKFILPVFV